MADLAALTEAGAFRSELEEATIKWNGQDFTIQIKPLSFGDVMAAQNLEEGARNIKLIAMGVVFEDGQQLTEEQAASLHPQLAAEFMTAIAKVNDLGSQPDPKD